MTGLPRRATAELVGSTLLSAAVLGSGIAASRLSPSDTGLQLLENSIATVFALLVIIAVFGALSGAHVNPVVTVADALTGGRPWRDVAAYLPAQVAGCGLGAVIANVSFGLPAVSVATTDRATLPHLVGEVVATAGLILVIFLLARSNRSQLAIAVVPAYIGAAYFFTSSTSFANPAITVGRMLSDTFAGIAPTSVAPFIAAQALGAAIGLGLAVLLVPRVTPPGDAPVRLSTDSPDHHVSAPSSDVGAGR